MSGRVTVEAFKALADRAGMCPAAALLEPEEMAAASADTADRGPLGGCENGAAPQGWGQAWSLPKRQLWECVCTGPSVGGQSLLECWLRASRSTAAYHALVDTSRALDPETLQDGLGERLLWVPVRGPEQAVQALDLLLRDANFALVAADLRGLGAAELGSIQPFVWYRLQRLAHERAGGAVVLTKAASVRCADRRILLSAPRRIGDLDRPRESLLGDLEARTRSYPRGQLPDDGRAVLAG